MMVPRQSSHGGDVGLLDRAGVGRVVGAGVPHAPTTARAIDGSPASAADLPGFPAGAPPLRVGNDGASRRAGAEASTAGDKQDPARGTSRVNRGESWKSRAHP